MVTGLNADKTGIVGNSMYDRFMDQSFNMACCNEDNLWWQQNPNTLPIWQANQRLSPNRKSGAVGFVGSLTPICGLKVHKVLPFSNDRSFKEIVDTMINWFMDKDDPLNFISIYFTEPDKTGHNYGPLSNQIYSMLTDCDDLLGYIVDKMSIGRIWDSTDIIITTDHGMTSVHPSKSIVLEEYIDLSKCIIKNALSIANIHVKEVNDLTAVYHNLSNIPNFNVYYRETVPHEYRYNNNIRIGDVVVVPENGYLIFITKAERDQSTIRGTHGYNNSHPDMLGIFAARGPNIAVLPMNSNKMINITDVYPLMEELLHLPRHNGDGSYENIKEFLKYNSK
ncbi:hypothetical protein GJ496_004000 [Pomphorhynchus laevis]|nr:hypothetical protein GJ496_004000 [Pomphorhynchus laevis]